MIKRCRAVAQGCPRAKYKLVSYPHAVSYRKNDIALRHSFLYIYTEHLDSVLDPEIHCSNYSGVLHGTVRYLTLLTRPLHAENIN